MIKKISSFLLALICILGISVVASADTKYTVRLYAGDVGSLPTNPQVMPPVTYGTPVTFDLTGVTTTGNYFAKGIREAGKDYQNIGNNTNTTYIATPTDYADITVTRDQDYVIVYGMSGRMVEYTINAVNANTGTVLRTMTYVGEEGDKPIIALPYINNFVAPGTHGQTPDPLVKGAANTWSVPYTPVPTTTTGGGVTTVTTGGGGVAPAGNANANANTATANANANSITQNYGPSLDIINDTDVPLAEFEGPAPSVAPVLVPFVDTNGDTAQRRLPTGLTIGLIVVLAGLIAALYWYLLFYRKKKKFANEVDYDFSFLDDDDHDDYR